MKNPFILCKLTLIIALLVIISPVTTNGQSFTSFSDLGIEERIELDLTPEIPGANQLVEVFANSYMFDIDKSNISWYINGSLIEQGAGLKTFSFRTGDIGQRTVLRIVVSKKDGGIVERIVNITPAEIDIMVEPYTYTPPFYKGGAIPTYQTTLKLVAIPSFVDSNGRKIPDSEIVYTWEINGDVKQTSSGVNKNVYIHKTDIVSRPVEVYLKASPINTDQVADVYRVVDFTQPQILIYENNPLFGTIFGNSIDSSFLLSRQEIKFTAIPLFFDWDVIGRNFQWVVNGELVPNQNSSSITFRRTDNNPGTTDISVSIRNEEDKILQAASNSFSLFFEEGKDFEF